MIRKSEEFERLRALQLTPGDYAIFGTGPLVVRGDIEATNDRDVLCRHLKALARFSGL